MKFRHTNNQITNMGLVKLPVSVAQDNGKIFWRGMSTFWSYSHFTLFIVSSSEVFCFNGRSWRVLMDMEPVNLGC